MSAYAQRYVDALTEHAFPAAQFPAVSVVGEIDASSARQPHLAVYLQLAADRFLGTTAGASARPMPLPVRSGLQYFELCALTTAHSPKVLWLLSNTAMFILGSLAPFFYGSDEDRARIVADPSGLARTVEPKPFLPYQTIRFGESRERLLLVPRWSFVVPEGPPVEVVEPLPIGDADWDAIEALTLEERAGWVRALGDATMQRWDRVLGS